MKFLNYFKSNEVYIIEDESNVIKDDACWEYRNRLYLELEKNWIR